MKLLTTLLLLVGLNTCLVAQQPCLGDKASLFSQVLKENRDYWVYLPNSYQKSTQTYPVIYVLDADINVPLVAALQHYLTRGRMPLASEAIIVGIANTNRTRDFTPTHVANSPDMAQQKGGDYTQSGGAKNFLAFIGTELQPLIDHTYRTNNNRTLVGHSFGALFGLYALSTQTNYFSAIIAADPSLWWDNGAIVQTLETLKNSEKITAKLYVSFSGSSTGNKKLPSLLKSLENNGLQWKCDFFENEHHGTVMFPTLWQAYKFLYK